MAAGGGVNHRFGLFDAILIKENHAAMAGGVGAAVRAARETRPPSSPLEVECRTPEEVDEALEAGAPRVLLDNMDPAALRAIVAPRRRPRVARGQRRHDPRHGAGAIAGTGVDFVSVGALTHSAPALDLSLLLEPLP